MAENAKSVRSTVNARAFALSVRAECIIKLRKKFRAFRGTEIGTDIHVGPVRVPSHAHT